MVTDDLRKSPRSGCLVSPEVTAAQFRQFRKSLGLSQERFADEYGIPLRTIQRWERADSIPNAVGAILRALPRYLASAKRTQLDKAV
ncbi:helix-turn-helix domain-containing protein [Pseudaquabacterium pictum]|uniref:helix-turn-helix domain-containing protein n=1 Tax=Pseudaquabacterium pictum TaxID=2315236 RepID=UPI0010F76298